MSRHLFVFLLVLAIRSILADDFNTIDGKEYKNVTVSRVEPDGIVLVSSSGVSKVYFTELSKEVQERFHYDAAKAATYSAQQTANEQAVQKQQEELRRKIADERNKYWITQEPLKNQQDALKSQQNTCQGLQTRYTELQHEENDLLGRIQEANRLPKHLYGRSGRKSYSVPNPARQYIPDWQNRLAEVRHEKGEVKDKLEQCR